jgi:predicted protein tyrosine phosphatase
VSGSPERLSFDRVTDLVWVGSRIVSVDDFDRLRRLGIRACVDMKQEGADPWAFDAFLWLPTPDHEPPSETHLLMGIAFLRQCEAAGLPVIVTCRYGIGRSPSLVLAHLLAGRFRGAVPRAALEFLSARRQAAHPNAAQLEAAYRAALAFAGTSVVTTAGAADNPEA